MRRSFSHTLLAAVTALLALPAIAFAARNPSYRLTRPHGSCRAGYVRRIRHVKERRHRRTVRVRQVWCVYVGPLPTTLDLTTSFGFGSGVTYYYVSTGLFYDKGSREARGQPLTYTITDESNGQVVTTFTGSSNLIATCTVVVTVDLKARSKTISGQSVPPTPGCSLTSVTVPGPDVMGLTASFAGNKSYAPSTSAAQLI